MSTVKKKAASVVAAVGVAAALAFGGTFAWQSISQTALNEASDVVNPGGRLHDDFYIDGSGDYNSDVYVENFADDTIFARVKLSEYMEVVVNPGVEGAEVVDAVIGSKSLNGEAVTDKATDNTSGYAYEYVTHYFDRANETDAYWDWTMGSADSAEVWYMPTFNKNKDSLVADSNGMYIDRIGGISNREQAQYQDADGDNTWTAWESGKSKLADAIYDYDSNDLDEVGFDFGNLSDFVDAENIFLEEETHDADLVGKTNGLISMSDWLELFWDDDLSDYNFDAYDPNIHGSYWVYDEDGWVYWSSPIASGETTGLLLDSIELDGAMDDTWYYAIEATGQFVTADDAGKSDGTGFYADDEAPSSDAETLLEAIGVDLGGEAEGGFVSKAGTLTGVGVSLYVDMPNMSIDEATNTITVNPVGNWEQADVALDHETLTFAETDNAVFKLADGEYKKHEDTIVDISCYKESNRVGIYLSDISAGQYKITVNHEDDEGNAFEGSIEFTIVVYDGPGAGESAGGDDDGDDGFYSTIDLWHDGDSDTVKGDEFLIFGATVYDEEGTEIAYTDDVTFEVDEIKVNGASVWGLFEQTSMDDNALFVGSDVIDRGISEIVVTASYTDEAGVEYEASYELYVEASQSPLSIGMEVDGKHVSYLSEEDRVYQLFMANPHQHEFAFSAQLDDSAADVAWSIEEQDGWFTVDEEDGVCYAYAVDGGGYDWLSVVEGDKVAQINTETGEFEILIGEAFPRSMQFDITAYDADSGISETVTLFIGRVAANFHVLNADEDPTSVDAHYATYVAGRSNTVNLGFSLTLNDAPDEVETGKLQNWVLYEGSYPIDGAEVDESLYSVTIDEENGSAVLAIDEGMSADRLYLSVEYAHGVVAPRTPDGVSEAGLQITEASVAEAEDEVDYLEILDEDYYDAATYMPGEYRKVKLRATPYTANGEEVYSGSVTWFMDDYENVKLVQDGFDAEVWLLKADVDEITVKAIYSKAGETSVHKDDTFKITKEKPEFWVLAEPCGYVPGLSNNNIELSVSGAFGGEAIEAEKVDNWRFGEGVLGSTAITSNGSNASLYVDANETGSITVYADCEYEGETYVAMVEIPNHPPVRSMTVYNLATNEYTGSTYVSGEGGEFHLAAYFFPNYTGEVQPIEDAYTGAELAAIASHVTFYLIDEEWNEISVDGVSLVQSETEPWKASVSIGNTVTDSFAVACLVDSGMMIGFDIWAE